MKSARFSGWQAVGLLTLLALCASVAPAGAGDAAAPRAAPARLDLSPWRGRVVLLDFWASWCGPCRESFPWMEKMLEEYAAQGLVVVTVNLDQDREAAGAFLGGRSFGFEPLQDPQGKLAEAYGIQSMPTSILFGRDGSEAFRHAGFRPEEVPEYERHLQELLEERPGAKRPAAQESPERPPDRKTVGARPWERAFLARPCMRFDSYPLDTAFDSHIYFSREASSGGRGFGGGGCGCN